MAQYSSSSASHVVDRPAKGGTDFRADFLDALERAVTSPEAGPRDYVRFPLSPTNPQELKDGVKDLMTRALQRQRQVLLNRPTFEILLEIVRDLESYEETYAALADDASREWMVQLLSYRIFGGNSVRLPRDTPEYRATAERTMAPDILRRSNTLPAPGMRDHLHYYELEAIGASVHLHAHRLNVLNTFLLEQYRLARATTRLEPAAGDVVIDCGGCWGDTALWFADRIGAAGRVFTFEFLPANLSVLQQNLELNPEIAARVTVLRHPVWHSSGTQIGFTDTRGPATTVGAASSGSSTAETLAIDDLVRREGLSRVDFIKMDIEGAELSALEGAAETLRRFRPKLALALYHRLEDWTTIPQFLRTIHSYRLFVDHFSTHGEETVLFAFP